mmetsp:Transcript_13899/g.16571  ORF Transcript_13899/g.16571 Transcript_13899/m.16571 type:complete len:140 (-) Transcript_13899:804-1223(-)
MIPTDKVYEDMMTQLETYDEPDVLQQKMNHLGFETPWLLPNLGSLVLFLGLYPLMMFILSMLHCCTLSCAPSCEKRRDNLSGTVFWNWPISYLRDSYVVIQICCLYNARYQSWHNQEASLNTGLSFSILCLLLLYPIVI